MKTGPFGRRGRALAAVLAVAAALGACGKKQVPADEYDPDAPAAPAPPPAPAPGAAPAAAPGAAPAQALTPEQDSAQQAADYARRLHSMETYESCMDKIRDAEEPARSVLIAACERRRGARP